MPLRPLPAPVRSLKARLSVLKRPSVWMSASLLLVALFTLVEYWSQPDRFAGLSGAPAAEGTNDPASQLSPLDPFSSVDEPPADNSDRQTAIDGLPDSLAQLTESQPTALGGLKPQNDVNGRFSSRLNASNTIEEGNTRNRTFPIPLPSALDRQAIAATTTPEETIAQPILSTITSESQPEDEASQLSTPLNFPRSYSPQPLPGQPSTQQTFPQPVYLPQTSPAPGTTGYTLPSSLRTPTIGTSDRYGEAFTPPMQLQPFPSLQLQPATIPSTIQPEPFGITVQPQFSQPVPAPFSIPRTPPGRAIGGGQINTFSNP